MSDYIDRQAALASIKALFPDMPKMDFMGNRRRWREMYEQYLNAGEAIKQVPSADISETIICGYPARHLAFIATVMQKEGVSPEEVATCLRDIGRMVGMIVAEQKEIIEKTWKEWGSV